MKRIVLLFLVFVSVAGLFTSCDKEKEDGGYSQIVGSWVYCEGDVMKHITDPAERYSEKYVFEKNGRFKKTSKAYSWGPNYTNIKTYVSSVEGSYTVDENKNGTFLYLNFDDGRSWTRLIVSITKTNLTYMDLSDGRTITWTKFNY
ncbi:MAG: hypothetical protein MJY66_02595 [Bacteroidaceae bacterium]|nr:hypothetical protein [Bacteroidaceae bacterium]